ncbi:MAG: hypothetical protein LJE70_08590 [Chromatiaceae bacterium]|nr:hypothetical protein [Chromatiaceae bacterium]
MKGVRISCYGDGNRTNRHAIWHQGKFQLGIIGEIVLRSWHGGRRIAELSQRPYTFTFKLIAQDIRRLEQWRLEGRRVTGVLLYRQLPRPAAGARD